MHAKSLLMSLQILGVTSFGRRASATRTRRTIRQSRMSLYVEPERDAWLSLAIANHTLNQSGRRAVGPSMAYSQALQTLPKDLARQSALARSDRTGPSAPVSL